MMSGEPGLEKAAVTVRAVVMVHHGYGPKDLSKDQGDNPETGTRLVQRLELSPEAPVPFAVARTGC